MRNSIRKEKGSITAWFYALKHNLCSTTPFALVVTKLEPVADEVAILDQGRIIRQAETDVLRRDVKQIILSYDGFATVRNDLKILDERTDGDRMAVTVEAADTALKIVSREGVDHRVVDLNLDEIFEAYVAGRRADASAAANPEAELQLF